MELHVFLQLKVIGMADNYVAITDPDQGQWSTIFGTASEVSKIVRLDTLTYHHRHLTPCYCRTVAIIKLHALMHSVSPVASFEELELGASDSPPLKVMTYLFVILSSVLIFSF